MIKGVYKVNNYINQFLIKNHKIYEIKDNIIESEIIYYPCSGLLKNIDNLKNNKNPFFYHYITDEKLMGVNGVRETERKVIPISLNMILNDKYYYIDCKTNYVYEYKDNVLQPLYIHNITNRFLSVIVKIKSY